MEFNLSLSYVPCEDPGYRHTYMYSSYAVSTCFSCCSSTASMHESSTGQLPVQKYRELSPLHGIRISAAHSGSLYSSLTSSHSSLHWY